MAYQANQTPTFLARITNVETGNYLQPEEVSSATYTVEQVSSAYGRNAGGEAVQYHTNQTVPSTAFLEQPIKTDQWTKDAIGYNFKFSPNTRTYPAFPYPGEYQITFKIVPVDGNPIVWRRNLQFT